MSNTFFGTITSANVSLLVNVSCPSFVECPAPVSLVEPPLASFQLFQLVESAAVHVYQRDHCDCPLVTHCRRRETEVMKASKLCAQEGQHERLSSCFDDTYTMSRPSGMKKLKLCEVSQKIASCFVYGLQS